MTQPITIVSPDVRNFSPITDPENLRRFNEALAEFERGMAALHLATLPAERREQLMKEWDNG